jgi:Histidine kinase-, DNA gyrase B-, and HSP90-like ATPase
MFSAAVRGLNPNYQTLVSSFDIRTMTNNPQSPVPDHATDLSVLVNPDRIRSSIKRLFHNRIDEVVAELFQNSQRSGSTTVDITTTENGFTIQDNGHGLLNGIDGFHTLLKLAESNFDNETIEDQDPMGLGIVSLLTHDQITEVTFSSGSLKLTIDTKLWWTEPGYYSVWFERMVTLDQPVTGLRISVSCSPELVKALHDSLTPKDQIYSTTDRIYKCASPAQGYEGILEITLNAQEVRTSLPTWARLNDQLISTTYKDNKLEIGYNQTALRSSVLWYGQLILQRGLGNYFDFHLQVTTGRPVNPLSPSRAGIIQDAAYNELLAFIKSVGSVIK